MIVSSGKSRDHTTKEVTELLRTVIVTSGKSRDHTTKEVTELPQSVIVTSVNSRDHTTKEVTELPQSVIVTSSKSRDHTLKKTKKQNKTNKTTGSSYTDMRTPQMSSRQVMAPVRALLVTRKHTEHYTLFLEWVSNERCHFVSLFL